MTDETTIPTEDIVRVAERVHWAEYRRAQNHTDDYEKLPEDMRLALHCATRAVISDLVSRGWRNQSHSSELAVDASTEPIILGPGCVARGDVIYYRGEHYRRARPGELVLDPAQGSMFRAFLDTLETTPAAGPPAESTPDEPCGLTHPVHAVACVLPDLHDGDHDHTDDEGKGVSWPNVPDPVCHRKKHGPWPTAADVPNDVRFTPQSTLLRHSIFKRTHRTDEYAALNDYTTTRGFRIWDEDAVDELAPFVRADGDQA